MVVVSAVLCTRGAFEHRVIADLELCGFFRANDRSVRVTQQHVLLDINHSDSADEQPRSRLMLKPKSPTSGFVDGAWWPASDDLVAELPHLLEALTPRLGSISRVIYRIGEWVVEPRKVYVHDDMVRLDGYRYQPPATIEVQGVHGARTILLVVPPTTGPPEALATMRCAVGLYEGGAEGGSFTPSDNDEQSSAPPLQLRLHSIPALGVYALVHAAHIRRRDRAKRCFVPYAGLTISDVELVSR
jgi:hypothetical protein